MRKYHSYLWSHLALRPPELATEDTAAPCHEGNIVADNASPGSVAYLTFSDVDGMVAHPFSREVLCGQHSSVAYN